jgi:peptide deformylase
MAKLPIIEWPDKRLKKKSLPVAKVDDELRKFMDDMLETMYDASGVGLAAVQVGVLKRILVMDVSYGSARYEDSKEESKPQPYFLINPEILTEDQNLAPYDEGCLSFPGQYAEVIRPETVRVSYLDYHGKEREMKAEGLMAVCVQHEIDHLNGIVFVDHISRLKRAFVLKKLEKAKKF